MRNSKLPAGVAELATRYALEVDDWETRGRLLLQVDPYPRVLLRRGAGGRLEWSLRLAPLPAERARRARCLDRVLLHVSARGAQQAATPVLSSDDYWELQAPIEQPDGDGVCLALQAFINEADYWRALLGAIR